MEKREKADQNLFKKPTTGRDFGFKSLNKLESCLAGKPPKCLRVHLADLRAVNRGISKPHVVVVFFHFKLASVK